MTDPKTRRAKAITQQTVIARSEHRKHAARRINEEALGERSKICRLLLPKTQTKN